MDAEGPRRSFAYLPLAESPERASKPRSRSLVLSYSAFSTALSEREALCLICDGSETRVAVRPCAHSFCEDCFADYLQEETSCKRTVVCPKFGCQELVEEALIERYLDETSFARYQRLQRDLRLEGNPDFRWCPQAGCEGYAIKGNSTTLVCSQCGFAFCFFCGESQHPDSRCKAKSEISLRKWAKRHNAKFCPNCRVLVQRGTGCSHMNCARCGHQWCWLCGLPLVGHLQCQVQQYWLWNPPWYACLGLLVFPALLPFVFVILMLLVSREGFGNSFDAWKERAPWCFYFCLVSVTLMFTPLLFLVVVLGAGLLLCDLSRDLRGEIADRRLWWCAVAVVLSVLGSPLVVVLIAVLTSLAPVLGCGYLGFKVYIWQRRLRGDTSYLVPEGMPGYPLG